MSKLKKTILIISIFALLVLAFSQNTLGIRVLFPAWLSDQLLDFLGRNPDLSVEPYKDGTIILIKPVATGVGDGRTEAGDIVEVRDGAELYQRFGDKPFLGSKERTRLLPFYIDRKLTDQQKQWLIESETNKHRKVGLDYTKFLSDKEISKARRFEGLDRIPEIQFTDIEEKGERVSVVDIPKLVLFKEKIDVNISDLFTPVNAATASSSIVDPDNGAGTDYTSLNAWEDGQEGNLVSQDEIAIATCRSTGGSADTTAVTIAGWTTDSTHYIKIWTDPDEGYRHNGKWDDTKYRLDLATGNPLAMYQYHTRIQGLQVHSGDNLLINTWIEEGTADFRISECVFKCPSTLEYGECLELIQNAPAGSELRFWNNIVYDASADGEYGLALDGSITAYIYNNTFENCYYGIYKSGITQEYIKNNLIDAVDAFEGTFTDDDNYNDYNSISENDNNVALGSHGRYNQTFNFLDETGDDFHLSSADTGAKGYGIDLSGDANLAFTDDIDGQFRSTHWDIGADDVVITIVNASQTNKYTSGLVGYWSFDGQDMDWASTTAEALDRSGNSNNGNVTNFDQNSVIGGISGQALEFDGSDDYVDYGDINSLDSASSFTISGWVKQTQLDVIDGLWQKYLSATYYICAETYSDGYLYFEFHGSEGVQFTYVDYSNVVSAGTWFHYANVFDGSGDGNSDKVKLYINGVHIGTGSSGTFPSTSPELDSAPFRIGMYKTSGYFKGAMDEVRVYDRALSADEITDLYQAGARKFQVNTPITQKYTSGLVGHWTFNGQDMDWASTTAEALDRSGNSNNGNVTNFDQTAVTGGKVSQALAFDGTDDYTNIGDAGSGIKTISFWMKPDTISKIIDIDGTDQIEINASSQVAATSFPAATVYVNGVVSSAVTTAWNFVTITDTTGVDASAMDIGRVATGYFDGKLDEVRLYNRVLSTDEITDLYRAGTRLPQIGGVVPSDVIDYTQDANCMGAWFMNASGSETDRSGDGNTFTEYSTAISLIPDECTDVNVPHSTCTGSGEASGHIPSGYSGKSRDFEESGGSVGLRHDDSGTLDISGNQDMSIVAWVKMESAGDRSIFAKYTSSNNNRQYGLLYPSADDAICGYISSDGTTFSKAIGGDNTVDDDTWHHVAMVFDYDAGGSTITIYLDGDVDSNGSDNPKSHTGGIADKSAYIGIGSLYDEFGILYYEWDGLIDEVAVFTRTLSESEIEDIITNGLDGTKGGND